MAVIGSPCWSQKLTSRSKKIRRSGITCAGFNTVTGPTSFSVISAFCCGVCLGVAGAPGVVGAGCGGGPMTGLTGHAVGVSGICGFSSNDSSAIDEAAGLGAGTLDGVAGFPFSFIFCCAAHSAGVGPGGIRTSSPGGNVG